MYTLRQKDICDYYPRCIISSGLMFDIIVINIIRNKVFERCNEKEDFFYKDRKHHHIYVHGVTYWKKEHTGV